MGAAVDGVDVVGEGEDVLRVRVVVLEGDLDDGRPVPLLAVDRPLVERLLVPVEMPDERDDATFEVERALAVDPLVPKRDPDALRQVGRFAQALRDQVERELGRLEHVPIRSEPGRRSAPIAGGPDLLDRRGRLAEGVLLGVDRPVARRFHPHPFRQRIDDAYADAVESAGHLVAGGVATELSAGMEHGVDDLEGILACRVLADGYTPAVVLDDDRPVRLDRDEDLLGVARHRFVDRVVDDFPHEVMEAALVGRADVHARASTYGLEPLEDLDAGRRVIGPADFDFRAREPLPPAALVRVASSVTRVLRSSGRRAVPAPRRCSTR